jgi:hypothetical protein
LSFVPVPSAITFNPPKKYHRQLPLSTFLATRRPSASSCSRIFLRPPTASIADSPFALPKPSVVVALTAVR